MCEEKVKIQDFYIINLSFKTVSQLYLSKLNIVDNVLIKLNFSVFIPLFSIKYPGLNSGLSWIPRQQQILVLNFAAKTVSSFYRIVQQCSCKYLIFIWVQANQAHQAHQCFQNN